MQTYDFTDDGMVVVKVAAYTVATVPLARVVKVPRVDA